MFGWCCYAFKKKKQTKKPRSSDQLYGGPTAGQQHAMGREGGQKVELKGTVEWHGRISNRNISSGLIAVMFVIQVHSLQWCTWLTLSSPGTQREFSPSSAVCSEPGPSRTVAFCCHQHLCGLMHGSWLQGRTKGWISGRLLTCSPDAFSLLAGGTQLVPFSNCPTRSETLRNLSPYNHKCDQALLHVNIQQKRVSGFLRLNKIFLFHLWDLSCWFVCILWF